MTDWQSIDTAPRDGTRVLLFTSEMSPSTIQGQWKEWKYCGGKFGHWVDVWNNDLIENGDGPVAFSHWMPLPPPPSLGRAG